MVIKYPVNGRNWELLEKDVIVCAFRKFNEDGTPKVEQFRIYRVSKPIGQIFTVYARHISYDAIQSIIFPVSGEFGLTAVDSAQAISLINTSTKYYTAPTLAAADSSDPVDGILALPKNAPTNFRQAVFDESWGFLATYGGEIETDGLQYIWHKNPIGIERPVVYRYGLDIVDFSQEVTTDGAYQYILPYYQANDLYLDLRSYQIDSEHLFAGLVGDFSGWDVGSWPQDKYLRAESINFAEKVDAILEDASELEITEALCTVAIDYYLNNSSRYTGAGISLTIDTVTPSRYINEIKGDYTLNLGDTAAVEFPRWGTSAKIRCVRVVYDVLNEKIKKISLGSPKSIVTSTLSKSLKKR
jgi:phage-related protein